MKLSTKHLRYSLLVLFIFFLGRLSVQPDFLFLVRLTATAQAQINNSDEQQETPPVKGGAPPVVEEEEGLASYRRLVEPLLVEERAKRGWCTDLHPGEKKLSRILKELLLTGKRTASKTLAQQSADSFVVIDIGANKGEIVFNFADAFADVTNNKTLQLLGIEPGPRSFETLQEKVANYSIADSVSLKLLHMGVAEKAGNMPYFAPPNCVQYTNTKERTDPYVISGCEQLTFDDSSVQKDHFVKVGSVKVDKLDNILTQQEFKYVDILYVDAQYLEYRIFHGALGHFNQHHFGVVVFEYTSTVWGTNFAVTWLAGYGYRIFVLYNSDLIEITPGMGLYSLLTDHEFKWTCHVMIAIKDQSNVDFILSRYNEKVPILSQEVPQATFKRNQTTDTPETTA